MKRITYLFAIFVSVILISCNEYEAPTSEYGFPGVVSNIKSNKKVNLNTKYVFKDLSLGVKNRKWSFSNNVNFVKGNESSNLIEISFSEVGECSINLKDNFINDEIVLDSTFVVEVLDSVQADFKASCDGFVDYPSTEPIQLEAGGTVHFTSLTKGRPTDYTWILPGSNEGVIYNNASINEDQVVESDVHYYVPGKYDVTLITQRTDPWGLDTLVVKDYVTVLNTDKNAEIVNFEQTSDNNLLVSCSLPIDSKTISIDDFIISRNNKIVKITSVSLIQSSLTHLLIKIEGGALNGDDISLSFNQGNVKTLMGTELLSCSNFKFTPYIINLVPNPGFEDGSWIHEFGTTPVENGTWAPWNGCHIDAEIKHSGSKSQYIKMSKGKIIDLTNTVDVNMKAGEEYMFDFWLYTTELAEYSECRFGMTTDNFYVDVFSPWHGSDEFKMNQWIKISSKYIPTEDIPKGKFRINLIGVGGYIDDFCVYKLSKHE